MDNTSVIKITRPDTSAPFFYDTEYHQLTQPEIQKYTAKAIQDQLVIFFQSEVSNDDLILIRTLYYYGEEEKNQYLQGFAEAFPDYNSVREQYCLENNHILERKI